MPNLTSVGVTSGVPTSGTGTVSTLDNLVGTAGTSSTNVISVQGIASGTAQPVSAASLPLPTGAATSAKQPALGTAGSASTDVITVQGIASGTTMPVTATLSPAVTRGAGATDSSTIRTTLSSDSAGIIATGSQASPSSAYLSSVVAGDIAHDGADSGNPSKVGGRARSSEMAVVSNNDRADFITDLVGKQIVLPYANPENFVSGVITSAMTGTTSTSLIAAPASGLRNYITQITVSNAHATVGTDIIIQDGSGGTTLYNIPAAAVYGGAVITFPTPLRQPTTATAIFCANVTTGASTKVSASGYKGV